MMNEGGLETPGKQHIHFLNPIRPRLSTLLICLKHLYLSFSRHSALKTLKPLTENLQGWTLLRQWWHHKLHHSATHIFNRKHQPILLKDNCEHFFFIIVTSVKVFFLQWMKPNRVSPAVGFSIGTRPHTQSHLAAKAVCHRGLCWALCCHRGPCWALWNWSHERLSWLPHKQFQVVRSDTCVS